jgi:hypothetical protein
MMRRILSLAALLLLLVTACSLQSSTGVPTDWLELDPMPSARSELPAVPIGEYIYLAGGLGGETDFARYHVPSGTWQSLPPLPEPRHHHMAATDGERLYVFGGAPSIGNWLPTTTTWIYDPATENWQSGPQMPERRMSGAAVAIGPEIYILGGIGGTNAVLRLDTTTGQWSILAAVPWPTEHNSAVVLDGLIYVLGGRWDSAGELDRTQIYDPALDQWAQGPALNRARAGFGAVSFQDQIWVFGGEVLSGIPVALDSAEMYSIEQGSWTFSDPLPVPLHGVPAAFVMEEIFIIGGSDKAGAVENVGRTYSFRP